MKFKFAHNSINVLNLARSMAFYQEALQIFEKRRIETEEFILVFLGDESTTHLLELTWIKARTEPYNLGDNELHLALTVDDFAKAYKLHKHMNCICYENQKMQLYFITDPDGYWIEILQEA